MCLAVPSRIVELDGMKAVVDVRGARREVSLLILPEEVSLGDYVIVHAGFAINTVNRDDAREALRFFDKVLESGGEGVFL